MSNNTALDEFCVIDDLYLQDKNSTVTGVNGDIKDTNSLASLAGGILNFDEPFELHPDIPENPEAPIHILIVDDFSSSVYNNVSHGQYVLATAYGWLNNPTVIECNIPEEWTEFLNQIHIAKLNIANDRSLAGAINAINSYILDTNASHVIINMSWVILKCMPTLYKDESREEELQVPFSVQEFMEYQSEESYLRSILQANDLEPTWTNLLIVRNALARALADTSTELSSIVANVEDDLWQENIENRDDVYIYPVAAAGNFNLPSTELNALNIELPADVDNNGRLDAFAPAAWPSVLAVSGSLAVNKSVLWPPSNDGQVSAPAAWIKYIDQKGEISYGSGTSFATPLVSANLASALAQTDGALDFAVLKNLPKPSNDFYCNVIESIINTP